MAEHEQSGGVQLAVVEPSTARAATQPTGRRARPTAKRTDIQGLRAIAVSLVVLFHLFPKVLTGGFVGVDVFLVVSGFLITSHLINHPPARGRDLLEFWGRRIRRLLPASLLVLVVSVIATWLVLPETRWESTGRQAASAAMYVVNWQLAGDAVDYLAADQPASAVQHFWSLAVEEQFYFGWPILVLALAALAGLLRNRGVAPARVFAAGIFPVVAASLVWSVHLTATDPARAYFVTTTRVWELGAGGLLAAVLAGRVSPRPAANAGLAALAWMGLAAIVAVAATYDGATPFPGWRACVPVLATLAVIGADAGREQWSPVALLSTRPVQWLGDVSYSIYLWHWPLIVIVPIAVGKSATSPAVAFGIVGATLILAALTKNLVEDRFRRTPRGGRIGRTYVAAAAGMALVVVVSGVLVARVHTVQDDEQARLDRALAGDDGCFGAGALDPDLSCAPATGAPIPAPALAADDKSDAYPDVSGGKDCWSSAPSFPTVTCEFGDPEGIVDVTLVGNSHAGEWLPALEKLAADHGWRVTTYLASRCAMSQVRQVLSTPDQSDACEHWVGRVSRRIASRRPDLVLMSNRISVPAEGHTAGNSQAVYGAGYETVLRRWVSARIPVLALHDTPAPGDGGTVASVPDCVAVHLDDLGACSGPRGDWEPDDPIEDAAAAVGAPEVAVADLNDLICRPTTCDAVVGGALVYFDASHLTATFARTLAPYLEPDLLRQLAVR